MKEKARFSLRFKFFAAGALLLLASAGALTLALRHYLSPDKVRALVIDAARRSMKREVRLKDVSVTVLKGLVLEDLEVSEAPDFKAGRFAEVKSFQFRVRLLPLLKRKVVVDRIAVEGLEISAVKSAAGTFNFQDLSAGGGAGAAPSAPLPFELDVKKASLTDGKIDYRDLKTGDKWVVSGITGLAKNASLQKPFPLELSAKAQQAGGPALSLSFSGEADPSGKAAVDALWVEAPECRIKIVGKVEKKDDITTVVFSRITGGVYGNSLDLEGQLKMTPDSVDLPALRGRVNDAPASLTLTLATPLSTPEMKAKGHLSVTKLIYGEAAAHDLTSSWDLYGITPSFKRLGGSAKLHVAGGSFKQSSAPRSGLVRALLLPVTLLKTAGSAIGSLAGLDFSHILFSEIAGNYDFTDGVMAVRDFHMNSAAANVLAKGTVDLGAQKLGLSVTIMLAKVAPIVVDIGGTFDKPSPRLKLVKTLTEPLKKLTQPGLNLLKNIFKPK